jgi:hypothetical protein
MSKSDSSMPPSRRGVSRRRFVQSSVVVGAPMFGFSVQAAANSLEAYASATSVKQGGTLDFFARDPKGSWLMGKSIAVAVTRMGLPDRVMMSGATATIYNRLVPSNASSNGCRWARSYRLSVPTTWPSGVYWATFGTGSTICTVPFVVTPAKRTAGATVMVQIPVNKACMSTTRQVVCEAPKFHLIGL